MARDLYQEVTDRIVNALEAGVAPWVRPWTADGALRPGAGVHRNHATNRPYSGVNVLLLTLTALERGYTDSRWLTFNQARAAGGCVRKGEKGTLLVFFRILEREERGADGRTHVVKVPVLRHFTVFNVSQIDGLPQDSAPEVPVNTPALGEAVFNALRADGCDVIIGATSVACYVPALDRVMMPAPESFVSNAAFWATAMHEAVHATGAASRCARDLTGRFRSDSYAAEELVAELGAAFLCAEMDLPGELQHASYIASWVRVLRGDKYAVFTAARAAREAASWLLQRAEDVEVESEEICA